MEPQPAPPPHPKYACSLNIKIPLDDCLNVVIGTRLGCLEIQVSSAISPPLSPVNSAKGEMTAKANHQLPGLSAGFELHPHSASKDKEIPPVNHNDPGTDSDRTETDDEEGNIKPPLRFEEVHAREEEAKERFQSECNNYYNAWSNAQQWEYDRYLVNPKRKQSPLEDAPHFHRRLHKRVISSWKPKESVNDKADTKIEGF